MDRISAEVRPYDQQSAFSDDGVEFVLNPSADRHVIYHFYANSNGSWVDSRAVKYGKRPPLPDYSWNSGAKVEAKRRKDGWSVRFEIPISSLGEMKSRFPANFCRDRVVKGVEGASGFYSWCPFLREFREVDQFSFVEP